VVCGQVLCQRRTHDPLSLLGQKSYNRLAWTDCCPGHNKEGNLCQPACFVRRRSSPARRFVAPVAGCSRSQAETWRRWRAHPQRRGRHLPILARHSRLPRAAPAQRAVMWFPPMPKAARAAASRSQPPTPRLGQWARLYRRHHRRQPCQAIRPSCSRAGRLPRAVLAAVLSHQDGLLPARSRCRVHLARSSGSSQQDHSHCRPRLARSPGRRPVAPALLRQEPGRRPAAPTMCRLRLAGRPVAHSPGRSKPLAGSPPARSPGRLPARSPGRFRRPLPDPSPPRRPQAQGLVNER